MSDEQKPSPDPQVVADFWAAFLADAELDPNTPHLEPWSFGDSDEIADELLELVLHGPKRATASVVAEYELAGEPLPQLGELSIVTDSSHRPRAVLRTTDLRVGPLSSVDDQFAWDEGEGDRSRDYWLRVHTDCFTRLYEELGLEFTPDIETVFERFDLIYHQD